MSLPNLPTYVLDPKTSCQYPPDRYGGGDRDPTPDGKGRLTDTLLGTPPVESSTTKVYCVLQNPSKGSTFGVLEHY